MANRSLVNPRFDGRVWLVLGALALVYALANRGLPRLRVSSDLKSYLLPALLWGLVALLVWLFPRYIPAGKTAARRGMVEMGVALGVAQVIFYVLGGLFSGFGKSPLSFTPKAMLFNLILAGATLAGMEFSRAWLLNHFGKRIFLSIAAVSVLFALLTLTLSQLTGIRANMATVTFAGSYLLPAVAESLLASLLALLAGPFASIAYRGSVVAFWTFCPVLPSLSWSLKGLIGVLVPILAMALIWRVYSAAAFRGTIKKRYASGLPAAWIATAVAAVLAIWFVVGVFPVHPVLILTGSMAPGIAPGDVAIVAKSKDKEFSVGDIVEFRRREQVNIVHRIVAIDSTAAQKTYVTKGDANDEVDFGRVIPENVVGKVMFRVPKVGWVADAVKRVFVR